MNLGLATHFMTDDRLAQTQVVAQLRRVAVFVLPGRLEVGNT